LDNLGEVEREGYRRDRADSKSISQTDRADLARIQASF